MIKDSFDEIFSQVSKVLVVLAHPDDMEITCGGIIARLTSQGKKVRLVVTTNGGKGTKDKMVSEKQFGLTRIQEQIKAGEILGIAKEDNFNLDIADGELEASFENIGKIAWHVREFKPDLIITHNPEPHLVHFFEESTWVNHRDHRNTGSITFDAAYPYSRNTNFFPEQLSENHLHVHSVNKLLVSDSYTSRQLKYFAIDGFLEKKRAALQQHTSAFAPEDADEYISENKMENGYFEPLAFYSIY